MIDRAQQVLRQALVLEMIRRAIVLEMIRRAMAAREPAAPKNSEEDPQTGAANPPTVNEA